MNTNLDMKRKNKEKKISIIMGIYNCESTLSESIDSILAQTYRNWQLILCDDGSIDSTLQIAQQYQKNTPGKIILLSNRKNEGLNKTLNKCLRYADGDFIARMDGDDISLPDRFEKEVQFLENHPEYAIVSTPMIYFDSKGIFRVGKGGKEPTLNSFSKGTPFCHAPCMIRAEAYKKVNGYSEDTKRIRVEDWDLWIRMYENGYKGYILNEPLYKMRDDRDAYSRRRFKYRLNEARVSASAVKKLKLSPIYYVWVLKPICVGILPKFLYDILHKRQMKI